MPVTLKTSDTEPVPWARSEAATSEALLRGSCKEEWMRGGKIIRSSFEEAFDDPHSHISPSRHGFVYAAWDSYSNHHSLVLRPEDIWFSILVQLSFYINGHAEELRSHFVSHKGTKELEVERDGSIKTVDIGEMAIEMTELLQANVHHPGLRDWIMPSFSTTTKSDKAVAAILMMGSLQKYFAMTMVLRCGIPSVTLLGERDDWVQIQTKIELLPFFFPPEASKEPTKFASALRPVLQNFVSSFDKPNSDYLRNFWNSCISQSQESGLVYLTGWVTVFCFWDNKGKCLYKTQDSTLHPSGMTFPNISTGDIAPGYASVPVKVVDRNQYLTFHTLMVAGLVGIEVDGNDATSIRPYSGWWMIENVEKKKGKHKEKTFEQKQRGVAPKWMDMEWK
ncbi:uncharacterized protein N7498_007579 [Penicillium cinerascens]|uniref:Uncharacterized protein n=1 Tax=Penicillium cinerascens TaxID=70096 RepID=A0A9W9JM56_9EURO|nr:uncharacterized protein N7498_007579 [Penicillium cinerascens]KAJ5198462.1 hypothetical protein N7498_007579 [Penicillium cinerascens]